jgi:F-type H+-transporting ATPase subunit delta
MNGSDLPPDDARSRLDPSAERVARVYAQAIVEAADAAGCRDEVLSEIGILSREILPRVTGAMDVLASPRLAVEQKEALIDRIAGGRFHPTTAKSLKVLARHGRLGILRAVADAAEEIVDETRGRHRATLTTAAPLDDEARAALVDSVERALGISLAPSFAVDGGIIGGLVVRVGDTVYDQSIASALSRLGEKLQRRTIHEIQHRRDRLASA